MPSKKRLAIDKVLSKLYPDYTIKLVKKDSLIQEGDEGETISINGIEIDLAWVPRSKDWTDKDSQHILIEDCKESIEKLLDSL